MFDNLSLVHAGCLEGEQLIFIVSFYGFRIQSGYVDKIFCNYFFKSQVMHSYSEDAAWHENRVLLVLSAEREC